MTLRYQPLGPKCTSTFIDLKANPMVRGERGQAVAIHHGDEAVLFSNHVRPWQAEPWISVDAHALPMHAYMLCP